MGYCGSVPESLHEQQMLNSSSWVHRAVDEWLYAHSIGCAPGSHDEISYLRARVHELELELIWESLPGTDELPASGEDRMTTEELLAYLRRQRRLQRRRAEEAEKKLSNLARKKRRIAKKKAK